jgi:hypothetical protein
MKKLIVVLLSFLFVGSAFCQEDEYSVAFKKLMERTGMSTSLSSAMKQMISLMTKDASGSQEQVQEVVDVVVVWVQEDVVPALEVIYRKHFSLEDINKVLEFYDSEIGRKFVEKQSTLVIDVMTLMQESKLQQSLIDRLSKIIPAQQQ